MRTVKAGCFLVNPKQKTIAIVYREKHKDYSFPKGHKENNETLEQCAIRETAEETKRKAEIVKSFKPIIERYTMPNKERCICYMHIAIDAGPSDNASTDTHDTYWTAFEDVEKKLSYDNIRKSWRKAKKHIAKLL